MSAIRVSLGERSYPVVVERDARPALVARVKELAPSRLAIVSDETVPAHEVAKLRGVLAHSGVEPAGVELFPAGEAQKTLATVERLYRGFLRAGLDRRALVIALGGGVVGDTAGFAAATWMRGIPVIHAPTTLVSMVDSAVGGKTGVNLEGKNLVGAFHQPSGVFASVDALGTLPEGELRSGFGELLKTALLVGEELVARVERDAPRLVARDEAALLPAIEACVRLKASIVERDEREEGERALLNLGHTLGHALEALEGFGALRHGEGVAIGTVFVARLALRLGRTDPAFVDRIERLARALGLPVRPPRAHPRERVLELMRKDKKARGGRLRFVLPLAPGKNVIADDVPESAVLEELATFVSG